MQAPGCTVEIEKLTPDEMVEYLEKLLSDGKASVIMMTASRAAAFGMEELLEQWTTAPFVMWYGGIEPNPTAASVADALAAVMDFAPERIVVFGGGSAIDTAKAVSALLPLTAGSAEDPTADFVREAVAEKKYLNHKPACQIIAVPTTAGSGSDVTHWATVWDPDNSRKLSVDMPELAPAVSLIVPELHIGMSPALTLSTGLDALCHAAEAFWAKSRGLASQMYANAAVSGIMTNLAGVLKNPADLDGRTLMADAALYAGLAFSTTRTTACHSISYPLTMRYRIPHGLACAMTLAPVAKRNAPAVEKVDLLFEPFGGVDALQSRLDTLCDGIVRPLRLSAWGVPEADLPSLAAAAFTKGRMDNNPVAFSEGDVLGILREVY